MGESIADHGSPAPRHRADLQGLRAVAVLLVVFDHAGIGPFHGGFVGIDVFFVLSGFLITGLLISRTQAAGKVPFADFYLRRARRILPAAALTLVAVTVAVFQIVDFVHAKPMVWDGIWSSLFAANIHFGSVHVDYFTQVQPVSPVRNFWTLAVEEQFYVVWPLIIFLVVFGSSMLRRVLRREAPRRSTWPGRGRRRLLAAISVAVFASLAWSIYDTQADP